jgi:hypothetical protein
LNKDIFKKQHDHDKPLKENEMKSEKMFEWVEKKLRQMSDASITRQTYKPSDSNLRQILLMLKGLAAFVIDFVSLRSRLYATIKIVNNIHKVWPNQSERASVAPWHFERSKKRQKAAEISAILTIPMLNFF